MIHYSPYSTTIGKTILTDDAVQSIKAAIIQNHPWAKVNDDTGVVSIYPNQVVRKFDHPIVLDNTLKTNQVAIDLTPFVRESTPGVYQVANRSLYVLQLMRATLTADLIENGARTLRSMPSGVIKTYSDLITNALATGFNVNPEEILIIRSLSAWLFYSLLSEQEQVGELELQAVLAKMSRDTGIPTLFLGRYIDGTTYKSVDDFILDLKEKTDNPTLKNLSLGPFFALVSKNLNSMVWVGLDKQQLLSVALEHIPSFVATVVMCLTEQPFKHAGLTKIALNNFRRDKQQFILSVNSMVGTI